MQIAEFYKNGKSWTLFYKLGVIPIIRSAISDEKKDRSSDIVLVSRQVLLSGRCSNGAEDLAKFYSRRAPIAHIYEPVECSQ